MKKDYKFYAAAAQRVFFDNIEVAARQAGVTNADIAKRAGISTSSYSMMKHGKRPLSIESMVKITSALNLDITITFI